MKKSTVFTAVFIVMFSLLLVACSDSENTNKPANQEANNSAATNNDASNSEDNSNDEATEVSTLTLGTGSTGGTYYPLGGELASMLNDHIDMDGFEVSSVSSGASVENIANIGQQKWQLGLAQNSTSFDAMEGEADFEGNAIDNFGVISALYPEALYVLTLESTGIESIEDLKGKNVAVGPPGGAIRKAAEMTLASYGIEEGDYTAYKEGLSDAKDKLQNGTIDATFSVTAVPAPVPNELQAATKEVKFLEINDETVQMFEDETPYEDYVFEPGTFDWQEEPVQSVTASAMLIASTDQVSEELGYEITKALFEHKDDISIKQAEMISEENAFMGVKDLPLHPGAKKYYEEIGILEDYEGGQ